MFNENQLLAINHFKGAAMVLAGPGSGKTTVISHRIRQLIHKYNVNPGNILVVTFTNAAAIEMKNRFDGLSDNTNINTVTFGTFHSVFYKILRLESSKSYQVISEFEKQNIVKEIVVRHGLNTDMINEYVSMLVNDIGKVKGNGLNEESYYSDCCSKETFSTIIDEYNQELEYLGKVDFDDMIRKCYELFENRNDVLKKWQEKYKYIMVDEFQDINLLQYKVVKMLAGESENIFIVGDDDQSIYGFRGANPENMSEFENDFPEHKKYYLEENYRCPMQIVELSRNLIDNNRNRYIKKLSGVKSDGIIDIRKFKNQNQELRFISDKIKYLLKENIKAKDIAILIRNNFQEQVIRQQLLYDGLIKENKKEKKYLYNTEIAKDVMAYIKAALLGTEAKLIDNPHLIRIINKPSRLISRQVIGDGEKNLMDLQAAYKTSREISANISNLIFHLEMIGGLNPASAMTYIENGTGYVQYIRERCVKENLSWENIESILVMMKKEAARFAGLKQWCEYCDEIENETIENKNDQINIITMHKAKGLEFDTVFIVDANQGVIPQMRAIREKDIEEERRLFYVAITRAKRSLNIYSIDERLGCTIDTSMFVTEMLSKDME